jgi:hypothetical protein
MVKFFERKKLTRKIRSIDSKIKKCDSSSKELKKLNDERERVKEDLAYVLYYPNSLKYVAIFADSAAAGGDQGEDSEEEVGEDSTSNNVSNKARVQAVAAWKLCILKGVSTNENYIVDF